MIRALVRMFRALCRRSALRHCTAASQMGEILFYCSRRFLLAPGGFSTGFWISAARFFQHVLTCGAGFPFQPFLDCVFSRHVLHKAWSWRKAADLLILYYSALGLPMLTIIAQSWWPSDLLQLRQRINIVYACAGQIVQALLLTIVRCINQSLHVPPKKINLSMWWKWNCRPSF
jgi:hypothetical protein